MNNGGFVISLDFELFWGGRDSRSIDSYQANILGVRKAIPEMLQLFRQFNTKATFCTVGFLFAETKKELLQYIPAVLPNYKNNPLSPFGSYIDSIGNNETEDPYHFAHSLIQQIKAAEQEVGCHTFSHYYCLEDGQTIEAFEADRNSSNKIAQLHNLTLKSFVFPRNQYNENYLRVCAQTGITSFRGNEQSWLYSARSRSNESQFRRAIRLIDAYLNISGHHGSSFDYITSFQPFNIPSSRFLRPYSKKMSMFESLRLRRIKKSMTHAAKNNLIYHLWWHPHNFGTNIQENMKFLKKILEHQQFLQKQYNFESITMGKLAEKLSSYEK